MITQKHSKNLNWPGPIPKWAPPGDVEHLLRLLHALQNADREAEEKSETTLVSLGRWWDAVTTVDGPTGDALLQHMDQVQPGGCGPVIHEPGAGRLLWLVPPGTASRWTSPYARCLSGGATLEMPPLGRVMPPGTHWVRPLNDTHLVGPRMLADVLADKRPSFPHHGPVGRTQ